MTKDPRKWLRDPATKPESHEKLAETITEAVELLNPSGKTEYGQLAKFVRWCGKHGISLDALQFNKHFCKYREAAAYLSQYVERKEPDGSEADIVLEIVDRITDKNAKRRDVREWARMPQGEKPLEDEPPRHKFYLKKAQAGCRQFALDDDRQVLVIAGPSPTVRLIRSAIKRYVDWDLVVDDDVLSELQRVG